MIVPFIHRTLTGGMLKVHVTLPMDPSFFVLHLSHVRSISSDWAREFSLHIPSRLKVIAVVVDHEFVFHGLGDVFG